MAEEWWAGLGWREWWAWGWAGLQGSAISAARRSGLQQGQHPGRASREKVRPAAVTECHGEALARRDSERQSRQAAREVELLPELAQAHQVPAPQPPPSSPTCQPASHPPARPPLTHSTGEGSIGGEPGGPGGCGHRLCGAHRTALLARGAQQEGALHGALALGVVDAGDAISPAVAEVGWKEPLGVVVEWRAWFHSTVHRPWVLLMREMRRPAGGDGVWHEQGGEGREQEGPPKESPGLA